MKSPPGWTEAAELDRVAIATRARGVRGVGDCQDGRFSAEFTSAVAAVWLSVHAGIAPGWRRGDGVRQCRAWLDGSVAAGGGRRLGREGGSAVAQRAGAGGALHTFTRLGGRAGLQLGMRYRRLLKDVANILWCRIQVVGLEEF